MPLQTRSMTTLSVGAEPSSSMTRPLIKMGVCGNFGCCSAVWEFVVVGGRVVVGRRTRNGAGGGGRPCAGAAARGSAPAPPLP